MAQAQRYKLKLSKLQFCSLVDTPAQPNAKTLLIKRASKGDEIAATARLKKVNDELGLAFFWAFTSTNKDGSDHYDLQGDQVTDFIKAAMDYMTEANGAVDVMHDGIAGEDRVVFAMPMDPDIAAAYGMITKQTGLMVVVKPTAENLAKLKSGELNGVSIGGLGERVPVGKAKRRTAKQVLLTSTEDGHQHAIDLDDPASWCGDRLSTTYANSEGVDVAHAHVWTFDATTGAVTLGMDSGHTHTVDGAVPASVLAVFTLNEQAEAKENAADVLERVLDGDADAGDVTVTIAARAPANKSTQPRPVPQGGSHHTEIPTMKLAKFLATFLAMSAASQAHVSKMATSAPDEIDDFMTKSAADREAIAKAAQDSDPVVFKGELTGLEVRKSDGDLAKRTAEQAETQAKKNRELEAEVGVAKATTELQILKAQAKTELGNLAGSEDEKVALLKAIGGIGDDKHREGVLKLLKGANAVVKTTAPGYSGEGQGDPVEVTKKSTYDALAKGLYAYCAEKNITKGIWHDGYDQFVKTPAGADLLAAHESAKKAG